MNLAEGAEIIASLAFFAMAVAAMLRDRPVWAMVFALLGLLFASGSARADTGGPVSMQQADPVLEWALLVVVFLFACTHVYKARHWQRTATSLATALGERDRKLNTIRAQHAGLVRELEAARKLFADRVETGIRSHIAARSGANKLRGVSMDNDALSSALVDLYNDDGKRGDVYVRLSDGTLRRVLDCVGDEDSDGVVLTIED